VIITCERCFRADDVTAQRLPDRAVLFTCTADHAGTGPHSWTEPLDRVTVHEKAEAGVTDELLEPLAACVGPDDPWLEYGIVEYRFRQRNPDLFTAHVRERGHRMLGPHSYTASSVRCAVALAGSNHPRSGKHVSHRRRISTHRSGPGPRA
jgi:hypothetical protein